MKAKTLKALKASIKHWERMCKNPGRERPGADSCALCKLFNGKLSSDGIPTCEGCPVSAFTSVSYCRGTPYYKALSAFRLIGAPGALKMWRQSATAEINFLKSLLPK